MSPIKLLQNVFLCFEYLLLKYFNFCDPYRFIRRKKLSSKMKFEQDNTLFVEICACFRKRILWGKWLHLSYVNKDGGHNRTKHFKHSNITLKYTNFIQHSLSSVGTVTELWAQRSAIAYLAEIRNFSLFQSVQTGYWVHPASYSIGIKRSFPGGKTDTQLPSAFKAFATLTPSPSNIHHLLALRPQKNHQKQKIG